MAILVKRFRADAVVPTRAHAEDGGWDFYLPENLSLDSQSAKVVKSGIGMLLPIGWTGIIRPRSSALRRSIFSNGTIDRYTGEIMLGFWNLDNVIQNFYVGDRVCQLIPVWTGAGLTTEASLCMLTACNELKVVEQFPDIARGAKGFGDSGA